MEFTVYLLGVLLTFGFGILAYQDRMYGTFGMLMGFVWGAFLAHDGSLIVAGTTYVPTVIGGTFQLALILLFMLVVLDIMVYNHVNKTGKALPSTTGK